MQNAFLVALPPPPPSPPPPPPPLLLWCLLSELMQNVLLAALPPPVVVPPCLLLWWLLIKYPPALPPAPPHHTPPLWCLLPYSKLLQGWCKMLSCLASSSCGACFLIQFLFKIDEKCSHGCLASCGGPLLSSYSKLMQNAFMVALPPPPVVLASLFNSYSE